MDVKDIIYDELHNFICNWFGREEVEEEALESLSENVCEILGICEKCGAKLKGERNE